MVHVIFIVEPTPLCADRVVIRAPLPYVPSVGSTIVFLKTTSAPRFEVLSVETLVHHYRWEEESTHSTYPDEDEGAALARDEQEMSVETFVRLGALESNAASGLG